MFSCQYNVTNSAPNYSLYVFDTYNKQLWSVQMCYLYRKYYVNLYNKSCSSSAVWFMLLYNLHLEDVHIFYFKLFSIINLLRMRINNRLVCTVSLHTAVVRMFRLEDTQTGCELLLGSARWFHLYTIYSMYYLLLLHLLASPLSSSLSSVHLYRRALDLLSRSNRFSRVAFPFSISGVNFCLITVSRDKQRGRKRTPSKK